MPLEDQGPGSYWAQSPPPAAGSSEVVARRVAGAAYWRSPPPPPGQWPDRSPAAPPRSSGLCAGALAAAAGSVAVLAAEGTVFGLYAWCSACTVLLALVALVRTGGQPCTNRWMAVIALLAGLAPLVPAALLYLFLVFLFRDGLYG